MKLVESFMTRHVCYKTAKIRPVKGLMLHSVGCSQPKASAFIKSWNTETFTRAGIHAFIDGNDGTVYQTLPWEYRAGHCGSSINGSANNTHIGVEMCEPATIKYTSDFTFKVLDEKDAKAVAKRTYEAAVELFAMLCKKYALDPLADGVIISHAEGHARGIASNHGDPEHFWKGLGMSYTMDGFRNDVKKALDGIKDAGTQSSVFKGITEAEAVKIIGELCRADMKKSGVLASVSAAQFILESGYGKSELGQNANNMFGMKKNLSGNTWTGSSWDGVSIYTKQTKEQHADGTYETITADFRTYSCVEDSVADHSAYLLGAKNGKKLRYDGIKGMTDYKAVAQLIKQGGYATSLTYVDKLCALIERWNLTQYDTDTPAKKTTDELAREVIKGLWGNGADRKNRLTAAGYDYRTVQNKVNEMLK